MANLRDIFTYDPDVGILYYKIDRGLNGKTGNPVGYYRAGYLITRVDNKACSVHRLIWEWMTGDPVPAHMTIDHINGVRDDNRWVNLRLASRSLQNQNRKYTKLVAKSGLKGAYRNNKGYSSHINHNGQRIYLGWFKTAEEAHLAYKTKERELREPVQSGRI